MVQSPPTPPFIRVQRTPPASETSPGASHHVWNFPPTHDPDWRPSLDDTLPVFRIGTARLSATRQTEAWPPDGILIFSFATDTNEHQATQVVLNPQSSTVEIRKANSGITVGSNGAPYAQTLQSSIIPYDFSGPDFAAEVLLDSCLIEVVTDQGGMATDQIFPGRDQIFFNAHWYGPVVGQASPLPNPPVKVEVDLEPLVDFDARAWLQQDQKTAVYSIALTDGTVQQVSTPLIPGQQGQPGASPDTSTFLTKEDALALFQPKGAYVSGTLGVIENTGDKPGAGLHTDGKLAHPTYRDSTGANYTLATTDDFQGLIQVVNGGGWTLRHIPFGPIDSGAYVSISPPFKGLPIILPMTTNNGSQAGVSYSINNLSGSGFTLSATHQEPGQNPVAATNVYGVFAMFGPA